MPPRQAVILAFAQMVSDDGLGCGHWLTSCQLPISAVALMLRRTHGNLWLKGHHENQAAA